MAGRDDGGTLTEMQSSSSLDPAIRIIFFSALPTLPTPFLMFQLRAALVVLVPPGYLNVLQIFRSVFQLIFYSICRPYNSFKIQDLFYYSYRPPEYDEEP